MPGDDPTINCSFVGSLGCWIGVSHSSQSMGGTSSGVPIDVALGVGDFPGVDVARGMAFFLLLPRPCGIGRDETSSTSSGSWKDTIGFSTSFGASVPTGWDFSWTTGGTTTGVTNSGMILVVSAGSFRRNLRFRVVILRLPSITTMYFRNGRICTTLPVLCHLFGLLPV